MQVPLAEQSISFKANTGTFRSFLVMLLSDDLVNNNNKHFDAKLYCHALRVNQCFSGFCLIRCSVILSTFACTGTLQLLWLLPGIPKGHT